MHLSKLFLASLALTSGLWASPVTHDPHSAHSASGSTSGSIAKAPAAVHGMVIFGDTVMYASHIPMFMVPHDWQAVLEVDVKLDQNKVFGPKSGNKQSQGIKTIQDLMPIDPEQKLYTLKPKPFVLPDLLDGTISRFKADLFEGNFEDGGTLIAGEIIVTVKAIVQKEHLDPKSSSSDTLSYYTLQKGNTKFLAHIIGAPDSFDQLVAYRVLNSAVELPAKVLIGTAATASDKLVPGQMFRLTADGRLLATEHVEQASIEIINEFYCTLGPDFYKPCD